MKVLFSNTIPFFLAHGGSQTVTEALMRELPALGVEVEPERWWDSAQHGDLLHYVGRPSTLHVRLGHQKGFKVVMTEFLDQPVHRSRAQLFVQRQMTRLGRRLLPGLTGRLAWDVYREADAMVFAVPHEWTVARYLFDAHPDRGAIIPHGLETVALQALAQGQAEEDYLVSIATIAPRKNSLLLAEAAHAAKVPVVFLGRPYSEDDDYFRAFQKLVDGRWVRYPGFVSAEEKYRWLRGARGFALLSEFESGCVAVYEAAAAGLPLILSDKPWAVKSYPGARETHFIPIGACDAVAARLAEIYPLAHRRPGMTFPVVSWREVAQRYAALYEKLLTPGSDAAAR